MLIVHTFLDVLVSMLINYVMTLSIILFLTK